MERDSRKRSAAEIPLPGDTFEHTVKRLCFRDPSAAAQSDGACDSCDPCDPCDSCNPCDSCASCAPCDSCGACPVARQPLSCATSSAAAQSHEPTETPATSRSLDELGPDLLLHILRRAHPTAWDLCRMACVSRTWRQLCYSRVFWTKLRVSSGSIRPGVEALAARCKDVAELHIDDPRCELFILHPIVTACAQSLQRVVINCDKDHTSRNEAAICSILWIISLHCKRVETVELISDGEQGGFDYIDNKTLWYLTSGFRSMRSFACLCKDSMTKQSLYLMVIAWRDLSCLRLHSGQLLREDLVCLRKCHALRVLELFGGDLGVILEGTRMEPGNQGTRRGEERGVSRQGAAKAPEPSDVVHAELEVLVLSNTAACPAHLASLLAGFPGLKRVLLNKGSWARGSTVELQQLRRQFGVLQRWLQMERGIELLMEE